jgi:hypothetical protein
MSGAPQSPSVIGEDAITGRWSQVRAARGHPWQLCSSPWLL